MSYDLIIRYTNDKEIKIKVTKFFSINKIKLGKRFIEDVIQLIQDQIKVD